MWYFYVNHCQMTVVRRYINLTIPTIKKDISGGVLILRLYINICIYIHAYICIYIHAYICIIYIYI